MVSSMLGAFYVFLLLDMFFSVDTENNGLSDTVVLFILSLPFLIIFIVGMYSFSVTNDLYDELKIRRQE